MILESHEPMSMKKGTTTYYTVASKSFSPVYEVNICVGEVERWKLYGNFKLICKAFTMDVS